MKILIRSLILLLTVSLLFSTNVLAKNENAKKSYVSIGDSIPYGYNLGNNGNNSTSKQAFPYLIGNDADFRVRNLAVPGWETVEMLNALKTDQKYRQALKQADYITLNIGNNDLLKVLIAASEASGGDPQLLQFYLNQILSESNVFANLGAVMVEIRSLTTAPIVVYNVYNPFQVNDPRFLHQISNQFLPAINFQLSNLVFGLGDPTIRIADAYGAFGTNQAEYVIVGDIHPTVAGQRELANLGLETFGLTNN
ncbi:GDSL-type esterase/lipase family protein [Bacillaceae bacterium IKA-2]|nr:GDSL-type esterase/lipase family protein [Bacillaceae bacterium IKA-2]